MNRPTLYHQIAESIRQQIMDGTHQPHDRLPTVREMVTRWACTQGTVQRAYGKLAQEGLVISRRGQGTRVVTALPAEPDTILRRAALLNRAESFLLESLISGYTPADVDLVMRLALDRWRARSEEAARPTDESLRFVGSHDPAVALLASLFPDIVLGNVLHLVFAGSLGGLIAVVRGEADLAGIHLWDAESDTYNVPFVRRLLPGRQTALLTLGHRNLGLIVPPGNPAQLTSLEDVLETHPRFATRQHGTGTRVWLDEQLHRLGFTPEQTESYGEEQRTHYQVAQAIADGLADAGVGVETAALAYGLDFIQLTKERYDLIIPKPTWDQPAIQALVHWLSADEAKTAILELGGYDITETGRVEWTE